MGAIISRTDIIELLKNSNKSAPILTGHLNVMKTSQDAYQVLNHQGRLICLVRLSLEQDSSAYLFDCSCVIGRQGTLCHHLLAVFDMLDIS